ncbi:MAG: SDR family NAD(P)-dependent oxidoreductase [Anaerolineales bacterium]|jgi:NAD(P)-dependent dehydrogenase (short-subunit alcohol dehydrogenase family)
MMKNAIIWGASGGIGRAILNKLNDDGWTSIAVVRDSNSIASRADYVFEIPFDDPGRIEEAAYLISQEVGDIDIWCYAAGDILDAKVSEMAPRDWNRIIMANLTSAFYAIHYSLPLLSVDAHILFIGAVSERLRLPRLSAYSASKAGLEALAVALSKEERKKRITVVRPAAVATPLWDKVAFRLPANTATPEKVAAKILEAYHSGHQGQLDLV